MDVSGLFLAILCILLISLNINGYLFVKLKRVTKTPVPTLEAQHLLAAIASGDAVLRITVIDPADFFLKSPRG